MLFVYTEGGQKDKEGNMILAHAGEHSSGFVHWLGMFHFLFLHFPIASALLAAAAELLYIWKKDERFAFTASFLLWAAALAAIPTAMAGLLLAEGREIPFGGTLWLHRLFGLGTLLLSLSAAFLSSRPNRKLYLFILALLVMFVFITGDLGGDMSFPGFEWLPF